MIDKNVITYPYPGTTYFSSTYLDQRSIKEKPFVQIDVPDETESGPLGQLGLTDNKSSDQVNEYRYQYLHTYHFTSAAFWAYFIIIIIVAIALAAFIWTASTKTWYEQIKNPVNISLLTLFAVWLVFLIIWLITAYVTYIEAENDDKRTLLLWAFIFNILAIFLWAWLFFEKQNIQLCIVLSVIILFLAVWWLYLVWTISIPLALINLTYIIWIVFLIWFHSNQVKN